MEVVIARPTGIYGPGDRRLLKLFRGVARRRFVVLGHGRIFYHLTYIDDLVEGFRLCGEVPHAAGRTYILAGGGSDDAQRARRDRCRRSRACRRRGCTCRCGRSGSPAPLCEAVCAPFGIEPPLYRRRVDFFTKSRAFDISRARGRSSATRRRSVLREGIGPDAGVVPRGSGWL